ncbi:hypothetical protein BSL82_05665 [Tardibacter chloracetimidivorans]|uniref:Minor tail T domain-containing protein n=1 Tax=Tardibacter chloracetimidivorans TaxID=1921510 RepID=A0A1L3ZTD9_9SPHN|nr:hypothetical protein [Tardibacter chloracetimidivorans]API58860.1 hypothetical protein BSL82_05665 [Tardibacter chloracetimidivorans]
MTLAQLEASLSHAELVRWMAYDAVEPIGQRRIDDGFRLLAALIYSANRGKDSPELGPEDFLKTYEPPVEQDPMAEAAALAAFLDRMVEKS